MTAPIAIVGAGWAGLAAAMELAAAGRRVEVFEASRTLGGRARRLLWQDLAIDNGQHLMIGAYTETLRLLRQSGADVDRLLRRQPLRLELPGEFVLAAPKLPAPLHTAAALLGAHGLSWREKWAAVSLMTRLKAANYRISPDRSVSAWLDDHGVPPRQRRVLWEPLCIAALNTAAAEASAQVLANVLRDSLGGPRAASDFLQPQSDLSAVFAEPAAQFVERHGGRIWPGRRVTALAQTPAGWQLAAAGETCGPYAQVVIATAPYHAAALLAPWLRLPDFAWEPIVTTYLRYPPGTRLPGAMLGLAEGCAQWLFDRGRLCGQDGLIAAVISARGRHLELSSEALETRIHAEIAALLPTPPALPPAERRLTVTEKRATFACRPDLIRPASFSGQRGLWLAGDYVAGDYPATLEGAVRSGVAAARGLGQEMPAG